MKHIIILGDGMADHKVERLGNKTLLEVAEKPFMDKLAKDGKTGLLVTVPQNYMPGSEVANTAIMGYDLDKVYEGRGPLEAASIGYELSNDDFAIRCNIITLGDGRFVTHNGGNLQTEDAAELIDMLNRELGSDTVRFVTGIQYRHLLVIKNGNKHIVCAPPHDHPNEEWRPMLVKPEEGWADRRDIYVDVNGNEHVRMTAQETADIINDLILRSQKLLEEHPYNKAKAARGERQANSIWPWSGGYRPSMETLMQLFPQVNTGSVISAVDLIRGIGHYAGLDIVKVDGVTGLADTNYEGKAAAAIKAMHEQDFVFVHVEATDEAGHDGDLELKLRAINYLDHRIIEPIYNEAMKMDEPVCIAVLPDHPTPVELRIHVNEPVPFIIWHKGIEPDGVQEYNEDSVKQGAYGTLVLQEFMQELMKI